MRRRKGALERCTAANADCKTALADCKKQLEQRNKDLDGCPIRHLVQGGILGSLKSLNLELFREFREWFREQAAVLSPQIKCIECVLRAVKGA